MTATPATPPLLARFCASQVMFAAMRGVIDAATEAYLADDGIGGVGGSSEGIHVGGGSGDWLDSTEAYIDSGGDEASLRALCDKGVAN
mmetsp:Transcript_24895/g.62051  ORF Transcript_24895/g.62051 Transcript_24895/m.62051 type:complete len:88 (+) Transcript_24895:1933-2196(+)